eukprot:5111329-Amphidinium_carterae.3
MSLLQQRHPSQNQGRECSRGWVYNFLSHWSALAESLAHCDGPILNQAGSLFGDKLVWNTNACAFTANVCVFQRMNA